jgi:histidinol-phosphate phosphatase family protein
MENKCTYTAFLDRDGTINVNLAFPNVNTPEKLVLLDRAAEGIRILNELGVRVLVVTNQAGINNPENDLSLETFQEITAHLGKKLEERAGAWVDNTFLCPHTKEDRCRCRKPATGLYESAMEKYGDIHPAKSFVVGDREDDILAGMSLGIETILVLTGHGRSTLEVLDGMGMKSDHVVDDLYEAALYVKTVVEGGLGNI